MKLLIDGSNMWFRAAVVSQLDMPGGPMLIMANMVKRLVQKYGHKNLVLIWDQGRGGRNIIDPQYKAQREETPGVWEHLPAIQELILALGISVAQAEGFEADDIIGAYAVQSSEEILIVSYDKDFYQLVTDRIKVLRPARTVKGSLIPEVIVDPVYVQNDDDFLCRPNQIILLKSFKGDPSDNLPKLPIRFGGKFKEAFYQRLHQSTSVESFYQDLSNFTEEHQQTLLSFKDRALLTEKIVRIKTEIPYSTLSTKLDKDLLSGILQKYKINPDKSFKLDEWVAFSKESPIKVDPPKQMTQKNLF